MALVAPQPTDAGLERHSPRFLCPICGGHASLPRGRGIRCAGFSIGVATYCTREEFAGRLPLAAETDPPAFKHRRAGPCACGSEHAPSNRDGRLRGTAHDAAIVRVSGRQSLPLAERHEIYAFLLACLSLRDQALFELRRRGLTREAIEMVGYRSVPATKVARKSVLDQLVTRFGAERLGRCPGFTDKSGRLGFRWDKGQTHTLEVVTENDKLRYRLADGRTYKSPSSAGCAVMGGKACNGWAFWRLASTDDAPPTPPATGPETPPTPARPARQPVPKPQPKRKGRTAAKATATEPESNEPEGTETPTGEQAAA